MDQGEQTMAKYDNNAATKLPLVESVIIIAIFALISVAIMRLYVAADKLQGRSVNISKATIMAENKIEKLTAGVETIGSYKPGDKDYEPISSEYYDKEWKSCAKDDAFFVMTTEIMGVQSGETGALTDVKVTVAVVDKEQLAQIETSYYLPY